MGDKNKESHKPLTLSPRGAALGMGLTAASCNTKNE